MGIKLDKDFSVILVSRYYAADTPLIMGAPAHAGSPFLVEAHTTRAVAQHLWENCDAPFADRRESALGSPHARRRRPCQTS